MKGIVLAGGTGSRLFPLTKVINKHLLPIYNKPMIYYPIECLVKAKITDILIVTGGNKAGDFLELLGDGRQFGLKRLHYTYQEKIGGIAQALSLAEDFASGDKIVVILGDNIVEKTINKYVSNFMNQKNGAKILLKEVDNPQRFGVPKLDEKGNVLSIEEKPKNPKSNYAITGIYMYDNKVFDIIKTLKPSARNELEITDVNNIYIEMKEMSSEILEGWWTDAGTIDSFYRANVLVEKTGVNNEYK